MKTAIAPTETDRGTGRILMWNAWHFPIHIIARAKTDSLSTTSSRALHSAFGTSFFSSGGARFLPAKK